MNFYNFPHLFSRFQGLDGTPGIVVREREWLKIISFVDRINGIHGKVSILYTFIIYFAHLLLNLIKLIFKLRWWKVSVFQNLICLKSNSYLSHDFENTVEKLYNQDKRRLYTCVLYNPFHIRIVLKNTYICGWIEWTCFCMAKTDAHSSRWDVFHRIIILKRKLKRKILYMLLLCCKLKTRKCHFGT